MIFNSFAFVAFAVIVALATFVACQCVGRVWVRNMVLLAASYWFYGQFNVAFLAILLFVTLVNYGGALWISKTNRYRKTALWLAVLASLLPLLTYKYSTFLLCDVLGAERSGWLASLALPVGISFFTFQALSYTIDVYREKIVVRRDLIDVALFVSFFPTVLSGPIEKARNLLPQIERITPATAEGLRMAVTLFVWGLFKKIVVADRLCDYVDWAYKGAEWMDGGTLALAAVFYSIQIYCDFSGYSDMALGVAKGLGFDLQRNFRFPYFSSSIKQFWRGWHISLTSWFTEYVYFSLGGNRVVKWRWMINISMVFLLSGLWHGAAWSFLIWGGMHAVLYLIEHFAGLQRKDFKMGRLTSILSGVVVFVLVTVAWVFFRADNAAMAATIVWRALTCWAGLPQVGASTFAFAVDVAMLLVFLLLEWQLCREDSEKAAMPQRSALWIAFLLLLLATCSVDSASFVYFQF